MRAHKNQLPGYIQSGWKAMSKKKKRERREKSVITMDQNAFLHKQILLELNERSDKNLSTDSGQPRAEDRVHL